ncbi:TPA: pyruvoyl-dependent arginine decarboxylase [Candidatus Bathyarchaeota archaeon]|nr:pyruvoyl-dependent arginine decarboxylase [Candidatus Bathyarchaeota archaeon]
MKGSSRRFGISAFVPTRFCVVSGSAASELSYLNAFDEALQRAGIANCNLVRVSSIIPPDARQVSLPEIPPGTVLLAVYVTMQGSEGRIGTGIAWGWGTAKNGMRYGIVSEGKGRDPRLLTDGLLKKLRVMAKVRGLDLEEPRTRVECIDVPRGYYGCSFSALLFLP